MGSKVCYQTTPLNKDPYGQFQSLAEIKRTCDQLGPDYEEITNHTKSPMHQEARLFFSQAFFIIELNAF
jgi:hypothetical protein